MPSCGSCEAADPGLVLAARQTGDDVGHTMGLLTCMKAGLHTFHAAGIENVLSATLHRGS